MHYKNGRHANEGDPIVTPYREFGGFQAGILTGLIAGAETCNGTVVVPKVGGCKECSVNIQECFHADDAYQAIDATLKAPSVTPPVQDLSASPIATADVAVSQS